MDDNEETWVEDMAVEVDRAFAELTDTMMVVYGKLSDPEVSGDRNIEELNVTENLDMLNNAISPDTKRNMSNISKRQMRAAYAQGRVTGIKALEEATEESMMTDQQKKRIKISAKLSKKVAVKFSEKRPYWSILDFQEGLRLDTAEKYFAAKAFSITGDVTQDMVEKARQQILNGIREGWSIDEVIKELEDAPLDRDWEILLCSV